MGFLTKKDPLVDLQRAVAKNENDTRSHLELGSLLAKKGDRSGAVDHYVRAAKAFIADKHLHKASAAAKQALVVDPKNIEAHEFLATLYEEGNLKEDARAILKKLVDIYFNAGEQPLVNTTRERLNKLGPGR
jgi:cytochrome c-type biogenesis protein CcmH/NrfG